MLSAALPPTLLPAGHRLVLVDATTINAPRSQGCDWRLQCRQSGRHFEGFELTTAQGDVQPCRTRWQVELPFKRLKSTPNIDQLKAREPALARSWILGPPIAAVMLEEVAGVTLDTPHWGKPATMPPWRD